MTVRTDPKSDWPCEVGEFVCHQCGNCCRGAGFVELTAKDIHRLAEHLGLPREQFLERYCLYDKPSRTWNLKDQGDELGSCIFLNPDNRCRVHSVKPEQCVGFPRKWRPDNIADFCEGWRAAAGLPPAAKRTMSEE